MTKVMRSETLDVVERGWVRGLGWIVSSGGRVFQAKKAECARAPRQEQAWDVLGSGKQLEPGDNGG